MRSTLFLTKPLTILSQSITKLAQTYIAIENGKLHLKSEPFISIGAASESRPVFFFSFVNYRAARRNFHVYTFPYFPYPPIRGFNSEEIIKRPKHSSHFLRGSLKNWRLAQNIHSPFPLQSNSLKIRVKMEINDAASTIVTATRVFLETCVSMIARLAIRKTCSRAFGCSAIFLCNIPLQRKRYLG